MAHAQLNLAALRLRRLPGSRPDSERESPITRRELLSAAGTAAAILSPAARTVGDSLQGPFKLEHKKDRAVFHHAGSERWIIDCSEYDGKPEVSIHRSDRQIRIELSGACYPGTDLPADFTCEITKGLAGWKMKLQHALGGFKAQAPFERWLLGQATLEGAVRLKSTFCMLGDETPIKLEGRAFAELEASGRFQFRGDGLVRFEGENPLTSDRADLTHLRKRDASLFEAPSGARTLLTVYREAKPWTLRPIVDDLPVGKISAYSDPFDRLHVEVAPGEDRPAVALLAESGEQSGELRYAPHHKLLAHDDSAFELKLRNARYAISFEPSGPRTALMADFDRPSWMYGEGCGVLVGDGPNAAPLEIIGRGGKTESFSCSPALLGFMAPLSGAVVEPSPIPAGETIDFELEQLTQIRPQATTATQINKAKLNPLFAHIGFLAPGRVRVVRPEDMLALQFAFINLRFQAGGSAPTLVRANPAQAAYLVVIFPPQHIAEEAGNEQFGSPPQLPPLPARTRMAGESRLAFLVPNTINSIPYTIEGLLDWSKLVPSVVPIADPPASPIRLPNGAFQIPASGSVTRIGAEIDDDNLIRFTKTARSMQTQSRDLSGLTLTRPKIIALSPQIIPTVQTAPKPTPTSPLRPSATLQPEKIAPTITALLEMRNIREPHSIETSIEAPWRVMLSPHDLSGWAHESDVIKTTHGNRTELWHTRLGTLRSGKVDEDDEYYRCVRAVWSPDYRAPGQPPPSTIKNPFPIMSLLPRHRNDIVRQSSDFLNLVDEARKRHEPKVIPANQFMLSSLGIFMDLHGKWDAVPGQVNLEEWVNRTQMGRDNFVRVVEAGYLMPFGHRAVLVTITERKIVTMGQGLDVQRFAVLLQRRYIEVKEPERTYPGSQMRDGGNRLPFSSVRLKTKRTPDMENPGADEQFFPRVAGADYHFSLAATDKTGAESEFSMPLMFVLMTRAHNMTAQAINEYNVNPSPRKVARMQGQKIGFAPASIKGDTVLDTDSIEYKADPLAGPLPNRCPFYPAMATANVSIPAARAIADAGGTLNVEYPEVYYINGFGGPNAQGEVYLRLTGGKTLDLRYDTGGKGDRAGGMASPNCKITGMSRKLGVVGGPIPGVGGSTRDLAGGGTRGIDPWKFNPKDFFGESAKMLGFLALKEIIPNEMGGDGRNAPKLTTKEEDTKVTTTLVWNPDLNKPVLPAPLDKLFVPDDSLVNGGKYRDCLQIKCELVVHLGPAEPTYDILGKANNFTMELFECIRMKFDYVQFTAKSGAGVDVKPKFGKNAIEFIGPLSFVNKLKDLLPGSGGDRALTRGSGDLFDYFIDPSPSGIRAGFTINVPSVSVGVFSLQNIGVGAEIDIPFTGDPVLLTFNFCKRDNPFLLSVWIFGGGGWFNLTVGLDGITGMEASFQFGVTASISFGIASGGVSVMAGLTYSYERVAIEKDGKQLVDSAGNELHEDRSKLVGYFEANGWVDVLGLISASLELYLGLEYISQGGQSELWGTARITFRIEILFLEFSVSAQVEKRFAGSGPSNRALPAGARAAVTSAMGGVRFEQIYSESDWNEYCAAFA